jgi:hypothetical protein
MYGKKTGIMSLCAKPHRHSTAQKGVYFVRTRKKISFLTVCTQRFLFHKFARKQSGLFCGMSSTCLWCMLSITCLFVLDHASIRTRSRVYSHSITRLFVLDHVSIRTRSRVYSYSITCLFALDHVSIRTRSRVYSYSITCLFAFKHVCVLNHTCIQSSNVARYVCSQPNMYSNMHALNHVI